MNFGNFRNISLWTLVNQEQLRVHIARYCVHALKKRLTIGGGNSVFASPCFIETLSVIYKNKEWIIHS